MTTQRISFEGKTGKIDAELALPASGEKGPAIVVVQEWHGINDAMKKVVENFAASGFVALAPDLYHGKVCTNDEDAAKAMNALDKQKATQEIAAAVAHLKQRGHAKVGVVGFCLGGALTFATVATQQGVDAAVPFYGNPGMPADAYKNVKVPIQAHFAKHDDWATASGAEEIKKSIESGGGSMELYVYDAKHAFVRPGGANHDPKAAKEAWDRAVAFLKKHLS